MRVLPPLLGLCALIWSVPFARTSFTEAWLKSYSRHILTGEVYNAEQLSELRTKLASKTESSVRPSTLYDIAIVRMALLNSDLTTDGSQRFSTDLAELQQALTAALTQVPADSFLWLMKCWQHELEFHDVVGSLKYLSLSYSLGPNEAWIATARNPIALKDFSALPDILSEQALSEFAGLVSSGLYSEAAQILGGPGWPIREKLMSRLTIIDEKDRAGFAKALEAKKLDISVPGVPERDRRPF